MKRILNLGAGTQSSVLLLMSERGELDRLDVAIFADTGWEPPDVYDHLEWLKTHTSIPVVTVSNGNIYQDALVSQVRGTKAEGTRWASMPYHVRNCSGNGRAMIKRQCTKEYKIEPIRRWIKQEILGLAPLAHFPKEPVIEQWFGLSADEFHRVRHSDEKWNVKRYPLIDMRWPRSEAINWARDNYPGHVFPRSACVGCPFHSNLEWQHIRDTMPSSFKEAVELDTAIRNAEGMRGEVFLHRSLQPLAEVDFRTSDQKNGQLNLFQDECEGICAT